MTHVTRRTRRHSRVLRAEPASDSMTDQRGLLKSQLDDLLLSLERLIRLIDYGSQEPVFRITGD